MNSVAYILMVVYCGIVESVPVKPSRRLGKKPPCGPVPFPDFSCEEVTTCLPVSANDKDGPLRILFETTCVPIDTLQQKNNGQQKVVAPVQHENAQQNHGNPQHDEVQRSDGFRLGESQESVEGQQNFQPVGWQDLNAFARQSGHTTSTFPPGGKVTPSTEETTPPPNIQCQNLANCKVPKW